MAIEFNPSDHLRRIHGGALYMDVADRKVWLQTITDRALNSAHGYTISTDIHTLSERIAVFRAEVVITDESGVVIRKATGWGSETPQDFGDYIEKAETKALGRALANCGFGTANAEPEDLIVDAPRGGDGAFVPQRSAGGPPQQSMTNPGGQPTQKQIDFYARLCVEKLYEPDEFSRSTMNVSMNEATKAQLSALIDAIKAAPPAERMATASPPF